MNTQKFRIDFNCGAEYGDTSLNKKLLSVLGLTNQLIGVLMRFRQEKVKFTSDIEAIFYQVRTHLEQRNCVKFL